jgi:hypothetical protein
MMHLTPINFAVAAQSCSTGLANRDRCCPRDDVVRHGQALIRYLPGPEFGKFVQGETDKWGRIHPRGGARQAVAALRLTALSIIAAATNVGS